MCNGCEWYLLKADLYLRSLCKCTLTPLYWWQQANKNDMQQQLAEMTAQLNALQTEHNKLTGRNVVLEKVLRSRQSQLQILQDQRKVHALAAESSTLT